MVGYRHSRLIKRFDLLDEWVDLIRTVEEAELGVEMKVYERRSHGWILGGGRWDVKPVRVLIPKQQSKLVFYLKVELLCGCLIG